MSSGRLFQSFGPTEPNERSPTVTRPIVCLGKLSLLPSVERESSSSVGYEVSASGEWVTFSFNLTLMLAVTFCMLTSAAAALISTFIDSVTCHLGQCLKEDKLIEPDPDHSPDAGTGLLSPIEYALQRGIL